MLPKFRLGSADQDNTSDWRTYQQSLNRDAKKRHFKRRFPLWGLFSLIIITIIGLCYGASVIVMQPGMISAGPAVDLDKAIAAKRPTTEATPNKLDKKTIRHMLANLTPGQLAAETIAAEINGNRYRIKTTIDHSLQKDLVDKLRLEHARYLGIVVLNPDTGHILSMISHDRLEPERNTCVDNRFPAASIFKIVTAAAAVEADHLEPGSTMLYNGRKHTLYKSQLKDQQNKWTRRIAFEDAFADSINPVFGKLGALRLGKEKLLSYAEAFGFNHDFDLDLEMGPSRFKVTDTPYQWAEMASGFNQETTLSPLHGAMIVATVVNAGNLIEPTLIDSILNEKGEIVYRGQPHTVHKAIDARTAGIISKLMRATVSGGTARKAFSGYRKDKVLSKLELGGKTGSINNDPRYDWYVGFAEDKTSKQRLIVSILVAHEKFIGIKSGQYAKMAIKTYFEDFFKRHPTPAS